MRSFDTSKKINMKFLLPSETIEFITLWTIQANNLKTSTFLLLFDVPMTNILFNILQSTEKFNEKQSETDFIQDKSPATLIDNQSPISNNKVRRNFVIS